MGVGAKASTPINSYKEENRPQKQLRQTNNANQGIPFDNTITPSTLNARYYYQLNTTGNYTPDQDHPAYLNALKYTWGETQATTMLVKGQIIDHNLIVGDLRTSTKYGLAIPYVNQPTHETSSLICLQITPYNYITEENTTIHLQFKESLDNWTSDYSNTINMNVNILNSTIDQWQQYIDIQNYAPKNNNWNIYQTLISGVYGTNYQRQERNYQFEVNNQTETNTFYDISVDINIDSSKTNYVYVYMEPTYTIGANVEDPYLTLYNSQAGQDVTGEYTNLFTGGKWPSPYRSIELSGYYIVPPTNYEVIDIPGMMWEILSMPFAFISTAFNLTLFPGTPYQVNISNLVLMVFGVLVFIFIFKLLLNK